MSGQHTPGPWLCQPTNIDGPDYGVCIVADNLGGLVGAALPWATEIDSGDMARVEANARLIAAAPELLEALRAAENHFGPFAEVTINGQHDTDDVRVTALMRAAIAKATGGAA